MHTDSVTSPDGIRHVAKAHTFDRLGNFSIYIRNVSDTGSIRNVTFRARIANSHEISLVRDRVLTYESTAVRDDARIYTLSDFLFIDAKGRQRIFPP